jgi:RNA polymerase-binding transcription factor DksA
MTVSSVASATRREVSDRLRANDLETLHDILVAGRRTLTERLAVLGDYNDRVDASAATNGHGETEHTAIDIERRVNRVLDASAREALDEHESALVRLENGTYGRCLDCRRAIPVNRLFAIPTASLCVSCRQHRDRKR